MSLTDLKLNNVTVATKSQLDRQRSPEIIFTDSYLEDPIQYRADQRFQPATVVKQFSNLSNQVQRDFAEFIQVDSNSDTPQLLTINMYAGVYRRDLYNKVLGPRAQFKQLGISK